MKTWDIDAPGGMEKAVEWMQRLLEMSADYFAWGIPRSMATYQINQTDKTFSSVGAGRDSSVERVLRHMGFTKVE